MTNTELIDCLEENNLCRYIVLNNSVNGGTQVVLKFNNGYGVSIVKHSFSYGSRLGLFELAVVAFSDNDFSLCYTTPITNDVIGYLTVDDCKNIILEVIVLPSE